MSRRKMSGEHTKPITPGDLCHPSGEDIRKINMFLSICSDGTRPVYIDLAPCLTPPPGEPIPLWWYRYIEELYTKVGWKVEKKRGDSFYIFSFPEK